MIFQSGKWPWKNCSLQVTFFRATMLFRGTSRRRGRREEGEPVRQEPHDLFDRTMAGFGVYFLGGAALRAS
jgi:hypothetical protein